MTAARNNVTSAVIDAAIEHLEQATGRTPSVLALARHLGLANTTFRRRYPDIVTRLYVTTADSAAVGTALPRNTDDLARLRQRNRELTDNLDLAVSSIQRLSIENRSLRQYIEELSSITRLSQHR